MRFGEECGQGVEEATFGLFGFFNGVGALPRKERQQIGRQCDFAREGA